MYNLKKISFWLTTTLLTIGAISLVGCKFDPKKHVRTKSSVLVLQPCQYINKVGLGTQVSFRTELTIKVNTSSTSTAAFTNLGDPIVDVRTAGTGGTIAFGKTYEVEIPSAYAAWIAQCFIETLDCGWPISGSSYSHLKGGIIKYEFVSPVLTENPYDLVITPMEFDVYWKHECS